MPSWPDLGMKFEQARIRLKQLDACKGNSELQEGLIDQVRACEGDKAANELRKEALSDFKKCTRDYTPQYNCSGNRQSGYGDGVRLGPGKWTYKNGAWVKK